LEPRLLLCFDGDGDGDDDMLLGLPPMGSPPAIEVSGPSASTATTGPSSTPTAAAGLPIPALNSLPGAPGTLYLDFAGDTVASFLGWTNITIPAFDTDGDGAPLSQAEVDAITGIWQIVAQNYAPYNLNVTTVDP